MNGDVMNYLKQSTVFVPLEMKENNHKKEFVSETKTVSDCWMHCKLRIRKKNKQMCWNWVLPKNFNRFGHFSVFIHFSVYVTLSGHSSNDSAVIFVLLVSVKFQYKSYMHLKIYSWHKFNILPKHTMNHIVYYKKY